MSGTSALPLVDERTFGACLQVPGCLALEAAEVAARMTSAVLSEVPEYAMFDSPAGRDQVFTHSLDHVQAVIRTIRCWSLPSGDELEFVHQRAGLRVMQQLPLSAL